MISLWLQTKPLAPYVPLANFNLILMEFNAEFCGMLLWELGQGHILNQYKIYQFHQIRSGIIMYGCEAYVFTPISNNDIHSHLKILLRKKTFEHNLTPIKASRQLLLYCREQCKKNHSLCAYDSETLA